MKTRSKLFAGLALGGALAAGAVVVAPANAAVGCPTGWTEPVAGICQLVVNTSNDGQITIPTGATGISAVLIGGGGGGANGPAASTGGAAGEVVYVSSVVPQAGGTIDVSVGLGGQHSASTSNAQDGGITTLQDNVSTYASSTVAAGGGTMSSNSPAVTIHGGDNAAYSGASVSSQSGIGGGAGSTGNASGATGGSGYTSLSAVPGVASSLWPASADSSVFSVDFARGGTGNGNQAAVDSWGSGGRGWDGSISTDGIDGVVVIRFAAYEQDGGSTATPTESSAGLASTGADVTGLGAIAGLAVVAGAVAFVVRRRTRSAA